MFERSFGDLAVADSCLSTRHSAQASSWKNAGAPSRVLRVVQGNGNTATITALNNFHASTGRADDSTLRRRVKSPARRGQGNARIPHSTRLAIPLSRENTPSRSTYWRFCRYAQVNQIFARLFPECQFLMLIKFCRLLRSVETKTLVSWPPTC